MISSEDKTETAETLCVFLCPDHDLDQEDGISICSQNTPAHDDAPPHNSGYKRLSKAHFLDKAGNTGRQMDGHSNPSIKADSLVSWGGQRTGAAATVVGRTSSGVTVETRCTLLTPVTDCVVLTVLKYRSGSCYLLHSTVVAAAAAAFPS